MHKHYSLDNPNPSPKRYTNGKSKGRTHQSFKDECDINKVMDKYQRTGILPELVRAKPEYGDYSSAPDYQEAQNIVIKANLQFNSLDARVRERFRNDPATFLEWASNASNAEEMAKLGLIKKEAVERVQNAKKALSTKKDEVKNEPKS